MGITQCSKPVQFIFISHFGTAQTIVSFFLVTPGDCTDKVYEFALTVFFFSDFLALAFAFLSTRYIVTQLIVSSEPVDRDVTFRDGVFFLVELQRSSKFLGSVR